LNFFTNGGGFVAGNSMLSCRHRCGTWSNASTCFFQHIK